MSILLNIYNLVKYKTLINLVLIQNFLLFVPKYELWFNNGRPDIFKILFFFTIVLTRDAIQRIVTQIRKLVTNERNFKSK